MKRILIAFDMDIYVNPHVIHALDKLKIILTEFEIPFGQLVWDRDSKGLDDWLRKNAPKEN